MKKKLSVIIASILGGSTSFAQAVPFNGSSITLNAGGNLATMKPKLHQDYSSIKVKATTKGAGLFGLQYAYAMSQSNSLYWAAALDFNFYTGKHKESFYQSKRFRIGANAIRNLQGTIIHKQKWSSNLDARLGYNFCTHAVLYGLLGVKISQHTFKGHLEYDKSPARGGGRSTHVYTPLSGKRRTSLEPVLGAGTAFRVAPQVTLGTEYRYSFGSKHKLKDNAGKSFGTIKTTSHAIMAKVSYHF